MSPIGGGRFGSNGGADGGGAATAEARAARHVLRGLELRRAPFASASAIIASARACAFAIFASCFGEAGRAARAACGSGCALRDHILATMAFVPPARHLLRAKDLADARYFEPLGVDDIARAAGLSRAHFSREFRARSASRRTRTCSPAGSSAPRRCCA